ncbi:MAG: hypothetical protein GY909_16960 [Oligoflexia bacterium]|nr:hypothetical protein [Oligoflexia bacterium]
MNKMLLKTFHCFFLSFVLYWSQCLSVYAEAAANQPNNSVDPNQIEMSVKKRNDKSADNDKFLEQNKENDESIKAEGTTTSCRSINDGAKATYDSLVEFERVYQAQNFDAINEALQDSAGSSRDLASTQGAVDGTAGEDHMARARADELVERRNETKAAWEQARDRRIQLMDPPDNDFGRFGQSRRGIIPSLSARVSTLQNRCDDGFCSQETRNELAALRTQLAERRSEYRIVRAQEIERKRELDRIERQIRGNQAQVEAAGDAVDEQTERQAASNAISGCSATEGTECELSGSGYQNYERVGQLINATTESAARLARAQTERANELALQNENNGAFTLFNAALIKFTEESDASAEYFTSAGFRGQEVALSNLEVMAYAGAATKDLRCRPEVVGEGEDGADSRAYHIFRAASATFLMAQINDTAHYSDTSKCRAEEEFTEDDRDVQFRTVQRAANLHTQTFENLCLRTTPRKRDDDGNIMYSGGSPVIDQELKKKCDEYIAEVLGPEYVDKPRTREAALVMFRDALQVAYQELETKNSRIADAHANVMKGEAWIESDEQVITTMVGLVAITWLLSKIWTSMIPGCCAAFGVCCAQATGLAWWNYALWVIYYGTLVWYGFDLIRARKYTAEWRRKLALAKKFTHLECNYAEAQAKKSQMDAYVQKQAADTKKAVDKARQDVLDKIYKKDKPSPTGAMFDQTINKAIKKLMANAYSDDHATLLAYDWTRLKKGATSSLPYDAEIPKLDKVEYHLSEYGVALKRKDSNQYINKIVDYFIPQAKAQANDAQGNFKADLTPSLGMSVGSSSFSFFLTKMNKAWQDFAFDAGTLDGVRIDMDALTVQTNNLRPNEKTGFPVPETRVTTIQNMIDLVENNLNQLSKGLGEAADQMDAYIVLLNEMRQRMSLGDQGLDDAEVDNIDFTKGKCLRTNGGGTLELDEDCDCKLTGTCATFSYPEFAAFVPNANTANGAIGEDYVKDVAQGNAMPTSVSQSDADSKAIKLSKAIEDRQKELNKKAISNNIPPRDVNKEANEYLDSSRKSVSKEYSKNSPELSAFEKRSGRFLIPPAATMATSSNAKGAVKVDKGSNKKAELATSKNGNSAFLKKMAALRAKLTADKKAMEDGDVLANLQELEDGDIPTFDAAQLAGIKDEVQEDSGSGNRYRHQRRPASGGKSSGEAYFIDNDGISGRNTDLFKVISKRYHKTAFPIFDIE